MTDQYRHDDGQADDDAAELARQLAELDAESRAELDADPVLAELVALRLPARHDPASTAEVAAQGPVGPLVRAVVAAGVSEGDVARSGRLWWRTTRRLVVDVDGVPAGIVEHRALTISNTRPGRT